MDVLSITIYLLLLIMSLTDLWYGDWLLEPYGAEKKSKFLVTVSDFLFFLSPVGLSEIVFKLIV